MRSWKHLMRVTKFKEGKGAKMGKNRDVFRKEPCDDTLSHCSINSAAFIFAGYCGIHRIQPAQEKQRASKQAAGSARSRRNSGEWGSGQRHRRRSPKHNILLSPFNGGEEVGESYLIHTVTPSLTGGSKTHTTTCFIYFFLFGLNELSRPTGIFFGAQARSQYGFRQTNDLKKK